VEPVRQVQDAILEALRAELERSTSEKTLRSTLAESDSHSQSTQTGTSSASESLVFARLLLCCGDLRELALEHRRQLELLRGRVPFLQDLYAETFGLL